MSDVKAQQDADAIAAANAMGLNQAFNFGPNGAPSFGGASIDNTINLTPEQARSRIAAQNAMLSLGKTQADIDLTRAQSAAQKVPAGVTGFTFGSVGEATNFLGAGLEGKIKPNPTGTDVLVENISPRAPAQPSAVESVEDFTKKQNIIKQVEADSKYVSGITEKADLAMASLDQLNFLKTQLTLQTLSLA